jgi:hypothetical protein
LRNLDGPDTTVTIGEGERSGSNRAIVCKAERMSEVAEKESWGRARTDSCDRPFRPRKDVDPVDVAIRSEAEHEIRRSVQEADEAEGGFIRPRSKRSKEEGTEETNRQSETSPLL